jgi:hypothetical protein
VVDGGELQGDVMSGRGGCGKRDGLIGVVYLGALKPYNAMLKSKNGRFEWGEKWGAEKKKRI